MMQHTLVVFFGVLPGILLQNGYNLVATIMSWKSTSCVSLFGGNQLPSGMSHTDCFARSVVFLPSRTGTPFCLETLMLYFPHMFLFFFS